MKVLQITAGISPRSGGSKALLGMSRELRRVGIESHIATTDSDVNGRLKVPLGKLTDVNGSLVIYFSSPILARYGFSWDLSAWLRQNLKEYDIAHFHGIYSHGLISGAGVARHDQVPYIVRPMGQLALRGGKARKLAYLRMGGRSCLNGAAAIHYTAWDEQQASAKLGICARGVVIPLGVEDDDFLLPPLGTFRKQHPATEGRKIVLFLSRIDPKKGLEILIAALGALLPQCEPFALVIAGQGPKNYEERIRSLVRGSGLEARTIFTGFVDGIDKSAIFRDADIFVLPSYHENFGMAIAEAMAAGLPVVVSDQVNIHDRISNADAGLVTSCDPGEVAAALKRLLEDSDLCRNMGRNAKMLVEKRYTWRTIAPSLVELYQSIVRSSK